MYQRVKHAVSVREQVDHAEALGTHNGGEFLLSLAQRAQRDALVGWPAQTVDGWQMIVLDPDDSKLLHKGCTTWRQPLTWKALSPAPVVLSSSSTGRLLSGDVFGFGG